jgi:hypothetical protein
MTTMDYPSAPRWPRAQVLRESVGGVMVTPLSA